MAILHIDPKNSDDKLIKLKGMFIANPINITTGEQTPLYRKVFIRRWNSTPESVGSVIDRLSAEDINKEDRDIRKYLDDKEKAPAKKAAAP